MLTAVGVSGMPEFSAYSASKHALVGLMRSAAAECAPKGLRINCINPATTGVCVAQQRLLGRFGGGGGLDPGICAFCNQGAMWWSC